MAGKVSGLVNRILVGSEKSETYARGTLPSNRWELFWDIFKGRFWKLVSINLLMLLFFIPLFFLLLYRSALSSSYGSMYPFAQCFGVGYQAPVSMVGFTESIATSVDVVSFIFLPIIALIASLGISGGAYVIRNMVWTEGLFVVSDFWVGIKQNYKQILCITLLFTLVFYLSVVAIDFANQYIVTGGGKVWLFTISKVISIIILCLFAIVCLHMITMCVTYEYKFKELLKNAFLFTIGLLPQNVFFVFVGSIIFLLGKLGGIFLVITIISIILLAFSVFLLIWTDYCQWLYDKFINIKIKGAKQNRGIYQKVGDTTKSKTLKQYKEQLDILAGSTTLGVKPVKPITEDEDIKLAELPENFNRSDIYKLNESRQKIIDSNNEYIEAHKNDPEFVRDKEMSDIKKEVSEMEKRVEKAKKDLEKHQKYNK